MINQLDFHPQVGLSLLHKNNSASYISAQCSMHWHQKQDKINIIGISNVSYQSKYGRGFCTLCSCFYLSLLAFSFSASSIKSRFAKTSLKNLTRLSLSFNSPYFSLISPKTSHLPDNKCGSSSRYLLQRQRPLLPENRLSFLKFPTKGSRPNRAL